MENYSVNEAKNAVKIGIRGYLAKDSRGHYFMEEVNRLPFYLEGKPGIGKTQMVEQIAKELGIGFVSFSITHHSRNTVLGLPVISQVNDTKYTEYTMSEIIAKVLEKYEAGEKEGILLLDEFNCMSDTIMPVMLSFLQTKNIGMHSLPEGWIIVLCGNPATYNRSARNFDFAVLDRIRRLKVEYRSEDFLAYAQERGFEKEILDFLQLNPNSVYVCSMEKSEENLVTARAWENLDVAMKMLRFQGEAPDQKLIYQFLKSERVSREFAKFYEMQKSANFNGEDCLQILQGMNLMRYSKQLREMKLYSRLDILETLVKLIVGRLQTKEVDKSECRDYIDRVIMLFTMVGDDPCLEKLFNRINEEKVLISVLSEIESKEYVKLVQKIYYGEAI